MDATDITRVGLLAPSEQTAHDIAATLFSLLRAGYAARRISERVVRAACYAAEDPGDRVYTTLIAEDSSPGKPLGFRREVHFSLYNIHTGASAVSYRVLVGAGTAIEA